ncbi:F-box-like protein [Rhizoctonia solani AG-3 Rhs1AP]|uniref:F-box-like protein n=1 Tax=Rhizoctonia solani AG-3 Rhs1AP TaxID=1086054 RepID=X8JBZ6_9AGAM|nr:F-box-like protein [Rhizoctonia solani AG-3 Rhs1AP]
MVAMEEPPSQTKRNRECDFINTLPNESLARIFILGKEGERYDDYYNGHERQRRLSRPEAPFQMRAAQICRRWRAIVIGMPELWSHIEICSQKALDLVLVSLQRAGPRILLEIEIDFRNHIIPPTIDYWDIDELDTYHGPDMEHQVQLVKNALRCLVSSGGEPSRWAKLAFWAKSFEPIIAAIDFLAGFTLNNLRTLLLVNCNEYIASPWIEAVANGQVGRLFPQDPPPLLHSVKLIDLPRTVIFGRDDLNIASVSNLTYLSLKLNKLEALPPLENFHSLFTRNRQLETFSLNLSEVGGTVPVVDTSNMQVGLPCLRRFSFQLPESRVWAVCLFQMIDAPELESLALFCGNHGDSMDPIAFYIAYGIPDVIREAQIQLGSVVPYCPIYPALRHLALISYFGGPDALHTLLNSQSNISELDWAPGYYTPKLLDAVFATPGVCPNLKHLRIKGVSETELARTVEIIIRSGAPLKTVQVKAQNWLAYGSRLTERFVGSSQGPRLEAIGPYSAGELEGEDSDFDE